MQSVGRTKTLLTLRPGLRLLVVCGLTVCMRRYSVLGSPAYFSYFLGLSKRWECPYTQDAQQRDEVYSLNPAGLRGIDPSGLEHFLVGD